jgi:hypothetical protein
MVLLLISKVYCQKTYMKYQYRNIAYHPLLEVIGKAILAYVRIYRYRFSVPTYPQDEWDLHKFSTKVPPRSVDNWIVSALARSYTFGDGQVIFAWCAEL